MHDPCEVYRARVVDSNSSTGDVFVSVPMLGGAYSRLEISRVNRSPVDGVWSVPDIGDVVLVVADDKNASTLFLLPNYASSSGSASIYVQDSPPSGTLSVGSLWFNSSTGRTYVRYDSYWVEM